MIDWLASAITGHLYLLLDSPCRGNGRILFPLSVYKFVALKRRRGCMAKFGNSRSINVTGS